MPVPFKVKAVYEYKSDEPDDLKFGNGQIITVIEEDDADWYTGEYQDASGQRVEGIFPRNFVEKYEPAIPSRPARNRAPPPAEPRTQEAPIVATLPPPQAVTDTRVEPPRESRQSQSVEQTISQPVPEPAPAPVSRTPSFPAENKPAAAKPPPPVADKPSSNSFRDRIAAFNKSTAAPVAPFKPGGGGTGFIKKPFVAPPPSRNSYVPPPAQPVPQKIYRREEDPSIQRGDVEQDDVTANNSIAPVAEDDQPKPTSLKDRIALLQQQQAEQAQKTTEKRKSKKPPTQRTESTDNIGDTATFTEAPLSRQQTGDTLGKRSIDTTRFTESELAEDERHVVDETPLSPSIPAPSRELVSDTNDADDSGSGDTEDAPGTSTEEERHDPAKAKSPSQIAENVGGNNAEEDEEDTEEEEDEETRRRRELRERMAKMSGGMGMMGMFGGGMPAPSKKAKPSGQAEYHVSESQPEEETQRAPPVPIMALPGMTSRPRQPQPEEEEEEDSDVEEATSHTPVEATRPPPTDEDFRPGQFTRSSTGRSVPAVPQERAAPPPVPRETRAVPPPPTDRNSSEIPRSPPARAVPPPPPVASMEERPHTQTDDIPPSTPTRTTLERERSIRAPPTSGTAPPVPVRRSTEESLHEPMSATSFADKRISRAPPPPIPGQGPPTSQTRAPPPPPPGQPPIRRPTGGSTDIREPLDSDGDSEGEVTEYDGDYDTDIASSAKHRDALKAHNRYSSMDDEGTFTDDAAKQASSPPARAVPPLPPTGPPRDVPPPPPPTQTIPKSRLSTEIPRTLPPPVPMSRPDDEEYDPYSYQAPQHGMPTPPIRAPQSPPLHSPIREYEEEDMYSAPVYPPRMSPAPNVPLPPIPSSRDGPPPPPVERAAPPPPPPSGPLPVVPSAAPMVTAPPPAKQSMDIGRRPTVRQSTDMMRPAGDHGFIASDLDLAFASGWWTQENTPPPSVQARPDVLYEVESSTSTKRGGKTTVTRDVYVLYMDYSQTTINVTFDVNDPSQPSISQSHERSPPPPRQDQLESASTAFGSQIARAASGTSGNTIGDGSAQSLVYEMLRPLQSTALMPIGTRSYGALVYANLGNASTQQFDEIRPGDIVTFRNAKFAGHKGGLHTKYSMDVGKPDHVGVVIDWDGTKKKIRAWEQGREEKSKKSKVRDESFRIGDLKSGEVRVWRVMPRSWVGWNNS